MQAKTSCEKPHCANIETMLFAASDEQLLSGMPAIDSAPPSSANMCSKLLNKLNPTSNQQK